MEIKELKEIVKESLKAILEDAKDKEIRKYYIAGIVACAIFSTGITLLRYSDELYPSRLSEEEILDIMNAQSKIEQEETVTGETLISEESQLAGMAYGQFDALYNNGYNPNNNIIYERYEDIINLVSYNIGYRKGYETITKLKESGANINENEIEKTIKAVQMFWDNSDKEYVSQKTDSSNKQKVR